MQIDLWKAKDGYTIGLDDSSLSDITYDEFDALIQASIELLRECGENSYETAEITVGDNSATVATDSLPSFIGAMIDLSNEEIPDDYEEHDSIYRCLMLDLAEEEKTNNAWTQSKE